ncbi:MAG: beta-propeller fold lactonase family protein [Deltaproteobacteria bacterium]|nr:beta-propeller fold lactonase family protein [Deltaproteobacteria bacterium]
MQLVRSGARLAVLFLLVPMLARAGGLEFADFVQGTNPASNGLRGAVDVAVKDESVYVVSNQEDAISVWQRDLDTQVLTFVEVEEDGVGGVDGLRNPNAVDYTSDGNCVYVATEDNPPGPGTGTVVAFARAGFLGTLSFVEVKEDDAGGIAGIGDAVGITVSLDGKHIYVAGEDDDAIAIFSRTPPACTLTFVGQVQNGVGGVQGLQRPTSVVVSPDGNHVYASARVTIGNNPVGTVVVFDRDTGTGALTYLEHEQDGVAGVDRLFAPVSAVIVSGFGGHVYAASQGGDAVVAFTRDVGTGLLTYLETERRMGLAKGFKGASDLATSTSDQYLYVTGRGDDGLAVFKRDLTTGVLDFLELHEEVVSDVAVLGGAEAVAVPPDLTAGVFVVGSGPDTLVAYRENRCGDGTTGIDEHCDDGCLTGVPNACEPVDDGDGCSSLCRIDVCGPLVTGSCHAATPLGGASLQIKDQAEDRKDQLKWSWRGEMTTFGEFGDPVSVSNYVICLYDGSGNPQPLMVRAAPAGGLCDDKPCWKAKPTSYRYGDKFLTPDGVKKALLKPGAPDGKAKVQLQGFGIFVDPPALPLTLPVTVQVKNAQNAECWEAVYNTADKNDPAQFKAKSD